MFNAPEMTTTLGGSWMPCFLIGDIHEKLRMVLSHVSLSVA